MTNSIYQFLIKYRGNWDLVFNAINNKEPIKISHDLNQPHLFIASNDYPDKFKDILLPPFFIFYSGDINLIQEKTLSIVGRPTINELNELLKKHKDYNICMSYDDLTPSIYQIIVQMNKKLIIVNQSSINDNEYKLNNNILLISEYVNKDDFNYSPEQTVERLLFAISNKIYLTTPDYKRISNLLVNLDQIIKPVFANNEIINIFKTYKLNKQFVTFSKSFNKIK